jgi:hypothetical protein
MKNTLKFIMALVLPFVMLTGCTKFGKIDSDKVVGFLDSKEIHCVTFGIDSLEETTLYIPVLHDNVKPSEDNHYINKKFIDQYANTSIYQYEFKSALFDDNNLVYVATKANTLNNNSNIFDDNHHFKDDGLIGTYVLGQYHLSIHKMANFFDDDRLYVGIQDAKVLKTDNLKEDNILAQYQNLTIHQLIFKETGFFDNDQYIYIAVYPDGKIMPLTNLYTTHSSSTDTNTSIRSTLVLMNKSGRPLSFDE